MPAGPLSFVKLWELSQLYGAGLVGPQTRQSYPLPIRADGRLVAALLYYTGMVESPDKGYQVWPPRFLATLDAMTGRVLALKAVTPASFRLRHAPEKPLGNYLSPPERIGETFLTGQAQMMQALDVLVAAYAFPATTVTPPVREAARRFLQLFPTISESPLQPYYEAMANDFFDYTRQAAGVLP